VLSVITTAKPGVGATHSQVVEKLGPGKGPSIQIVWLLPS